MPSRTNLTPAQKAGGLWLKNKRIAAGLTQNELARLTGMNYYTFISQMEGGTRVPAERYREFARALKMDVKEFTREQLRFFEPEIYDILFGTKDRRDGPGGSRSAPRH
jgi:transcriptional regulator with XRE-family HTH domain